VLVSRQVGEHLIEEDQSFLLLQDMRRSLEFAKSRAPKCVFTLEVHTLLSENTPELFGLPLETIGIVPGALLEVTDADGSLLLSHHATTGSIGSCGRSVASSLSDESDRFAR
jgi:hypothetical protein